MRRRPPSPALVLPLVLCLSLAVHAVEPAPAEPAKPAAPQKPVEPAPAFVVVLDPGHGGEHAGAVGPRQLKEKDVTLAVALRLKARLEAVPGVSVLLTREDDVDVGLHARMVFANTKKADLFVSLHANSMPTRLSRKEAHGVETYFLSADPSSAEARMLADAENADAPEDAPQATDDPVGLILQDLARTAAHVDAAAFAKLVHRSIVKGTQTKSRGVKQAPFYVLIGAEMPAILVEMGFISHPWEGRRLSDPAHQEKLAAAIDSGIAEFRRTVVDRRNAGFEPHVVEDPPVDAEHAAEPSDGAADTH